MKELKIIYNSGSAQEMILCGEAVDAALKGYEIIWDERVDGPVPAGIDPVTVSRSGGKLVPDKSKIAAVAAEREAFSKNQKEKQDEAAEYAALKEKAKAGTATTVDLSQMVLRLMEISGDPYFDSVVDAGGKDAKR